MQQYNRGTHWIISCVLLYSVFCIILCLKLFICPFGLYLGYINIVFGGVLVWPERCDIKYRKALYLRKLILKYNV